MEGSLLLLSFLPSDVCVRAGYVVPDAFALRGCNSHGAPPVFNKSNL